MRFVSIVLIILQLTVAAALSADKPVKSSKDPVPEKKIEQPKPLPTAVMTQGDFARELVAAFGWSGGLTAEPKDREYLQILEGRRTFKFEAEKIYNAKTDSVSLGKNKLHGPFSGESWLSGITTPTKVRMKVFLPIGGDFQMSAAVKGAGQVWTIGGKEYAASSGNKLALTKIADLNLNAGNHEIELMLPPEGALDYLLFTAPDYTPIEPLDGWRFSERLNNLTVAYVAASILGLESKLPVDDRVKPITVIVAEMPGLPDAASLMDLRYYGSFSGKNWVGTSNRPAEITIPFTLPQTGTYDVKLRIMGKGFSGEFDGNPVKLEAKAYLDWVGLGLQRLSQGQHAFKINVPPHAGIDALVVTPRMASPEAYMNLTGISGDPQAVVTYAEMMRQIEQIRSRFSSRK